MNVAIYREGHGIGFALPIKQVTEALSEIFLPEVTHSAWFGARIKSGPYPLMVTEVEPESPAAKYRVAVRTALGRQQHLPAGRRQIGHAKRLLDRVGTT